MQELTSTSTVDTLIAFISERYYICKCYDITTYILYFPLLQLTDKQKTQVCFKIWISVYSS